MGKKASFIPKGDDGQVPLLQRRRVRAGHVQGPAADAEEPAPADRGLHHRLDRRRRQQGLHLHPRRVRAPGRHPRDGRRGGLRRATWASASSAPTTTSTWWCTAAQGAYICGEESGLLDALEGKRGNPRLKPPFPANQGLYQGPTLINNVETLCNAPAIIEKRRRLVQVGSATGKSTGTKLVSVSGNVQRPGNYEIELGITGARHRLRPRRRPARRAARSSACSPAARRRRCSPEEPSTCPTLRGHGRGRLDARLRRDHRGRRRDADRPLALRLAEFYRHESCGKCVPCREGTNWTVKMLERIDARRGHADGPGDHGPGPGEHHRQLPVRARRLDGDADRLDDQALPAGVRGAHRAGPRARADPSGDRPRAPASWPPVAAGAGVRLPMPRPEPKSSPSRSTAARSRARGRDAGRRRQVRRRRDPRTSVTSPSSAQPVGACRMCLVEIEGIPKLQTSCSTPVKDGMVVNTTSDRVKNAQEAVVEFLLINHPLDCPVCDKGGECPLQDISFGWGAGRSRYIEPKRHFKKPLELSPLVAIDRERCILCYRCVRFSQEIAEDYQLVFLERGDHTFVGTHDGRPYVGAVQRQHHRAVPGGRAHLDLVPLPRAPVGHRGRGRALHALPVAVQRRTSPSATTQGACASTRARQRRRRRRLAVRQGPLRLPVHPRARAHHAAAGARRRRAARGLVGARAATRRPPRSTRRASGRRRWSAARPPTRRASSSST